MSLRISSKHGKKDVIVLVRDGPGDMHDVYSFSKSSKAGIRAVLKKVGVD